MIRLNFAPRLMLAMMFIVTLVAGCIFAATRESLETAWREIIETRFTTQTESLANMQKVRLDSIQERCRELAASDTVIKALQSGTAELPPEIQRQLLRSAWVVQASASSFGDNAAPRPGDPGGPGGGDRFPAPPDANPFRPFSTRVPLRPPEEENRVAADRRPGSEAASGRRRGLRLNGGREGAAGFLSDSGIPFLPAGNRPAPGPDGGGPSAGDAPPKAPAEAAVPPSTPPPSTPASSPSKTSPTAGSGQMPEPSPGLSGGAGNPPGAASASVPEGAPPFQRPNTQDSRRRFGWGQPTSLDLALMDAEGRIRTIRFGEGSDAQTEWLEKNKVKRVPASQEVAYMNLKPEIPPQAPGQNPANRPPPRGGGLREVIITPIKKPGTGEALGALIVGLPVSTYGESALYDLKREDKPGELFTGLWIDDQLFSQTIPEAVRDLVSATVRRNIASLEDQDDRDGKNDREESTIRIDGRPYQIRFRSMNASPSTPPAYQITLFSLAGLVADKNEVRGKIITYSVLAFGAAMLLSWWLARRMVHPVRALVEGTHKIKNGQYDTRVPITTQDELATLATAFNEMAEGLRQRERYRDILFQVSDDDIARQLIETACLGGERREISVLFCDIRNFTATTSGMAPEGIIDMLNEHMTALTETVHRHHGVVDKFVGDLIMAIFGAPKSYGDDAGNAAACALEMVARREELNQTTAHPPLLMGIGIASGTVVAGCMGSENRLNYTVLGEPVNLASRLCSAAGPREVILDPHTVSLLGTRAAGHLLRPLLLKGFPDPVQPFHLTRLVETKPVQNPQQTSLGAGVGASGKNHA